MHALALPQVPRDPSHVRVYSGTHSYIPRTSPTPSVALLLMLPSEPLFGPDGPWIQGCVRMGDMRAAALCDQHSKSFQVRHMMGHNSSGIRTAMGAAHNLQL